MNAAIRAVTLVGRWLVDLGGLLAETDNLLQGKTTLARWRVGAFDEIEDALLL